MQSAAPTVPIRDYKEELKYIEKLTPHSFRIKKGFVPNMQVEGIFYVNSHLENLMMDELRHSCQSKGIGGFLPGVKQIANVASLPGIVGRSVGLPDVHSGYGFAIGNMAAFDMSNPDAVVSPGGVGFDINCGVRLLRTNLSEKDVAPLKEDLAQTLFNHIPVGVGSKGIIPMTATNLEEALEMGMDWSLREGYAWAEDKEHCEEYGRMLQANPNKVSSRAKKRGLPQLGTLGAGNHYAEIQVVDKIYDQHAARKMGIDHDGQVCVMVHSGSRGLGHQVATDALVAMERAMKRDNIVVNDRQLACARISSQEGQDYLQAMAAAANYAWVNRSSMTFLARQAFAKTFRTTPDDLDMQVIYDVSHNIAKVEEHFIDGRQKTLLVHRKGSTRAFPPHHPLIPVDYQLTGQPVLIGGTMGTCSYVLTGTEQGMQETFGTTCHGAGRALSRAKSRRNLNYEDVLDDLRKKGIAIRVASPKLVMEEAPESYKNVTDVVETCSLKSLSQLKCENNQLHVLPDTIGRLKNLKELFLTDNMLEHLPSTIGELEKLTTLYVDRNHLLSVPPELCTCQRLSIMNFRQNSLTRIPPDYGMISTLRVVDLCNNMLDTLPSSFLHLNLKALWLSDNQSKPLMELQMETDSVTKEELLTCILLPQSTGQSQSLENLLVGTNGSSFGDPDATSRASQVTGSSHDRTTRVAFAADTQDRTGDTDVENQAKLQRHPTPYIKDLRAKAKRHRDGRKSPDGSKRSSTGSLVPSESAATPPVVRAEDEADKSGKAHKGVAFSEDTKEAPDGASGSRIAAVMRHDTPHPSTLAQRMEEAKSTEEGLLDNNLDETQAAVPAVVSFEATEHSSDKHVSFVEEDDVNAAAEDVEKEKEPLSKLSRKDTPKPKQYNPDDSKLRRRDTPRNYGTPTYGMSSPATAEILEEAEEEEEEEAKLEQLMEKKAPPAEEYDTIVAVLVRTNTGLGFSISGGIGCNPRYRVDNEYVYVTKIAPGGLADTEGSMKPGDQIVSVNDVDYMDGISHEKAVETLKKTSGAVRFVLRRPVPTRNMGPQVLITSASVEKEDEFDDRQTETPPTPEESKRPLAIEEEKEPDDSDTRVVSITRSGQSLGMTIVGGSDTSPLPFGTQLLDDEGIYISKIVPGGLADQCGKLEIGDQIVSVNGQRLESQSHGTAVACLVGADLVSMVIKRVGPPPGIQTVTFSKADDEKLGLSIRGGSGAAKSGNPNNEKDEGVFISKINAGGAASRCGEFRVGQRIIDVNGNTLLGATHHEAVRVLKSVGKDVKFIVCDGYEPPEDASLLDASLISKASVDVPAVDVPPVIVETPSTGEAVVAVPTEPETAAEETRAPEPTDEAVSQPVADEPLTDNQPKEQETTSPPVDEPTAVSGAEGVEELETAAPATAEPETTAEEETPAPEGQQEVEESAADTPADEPAKSEEEAPAEDAPAEDAPAEDAPAEDAPSTPAKKAEDGVEIGGHSLRSTPAREARVEEDATPGAAAAADGEEEEESTAAAAAITGDSQPTTPSKKHKKHKKKRHSDAGQAATSGDREHKKHKHKKHKSHDAEK